MSFNAGCQKMLCQFTLFEEIGEVVYETRKLILDGLQPEYMTIPKLTVHKFFDIRNLPNCVGSIDCKHIRINKIPKTGSENFNCKSYNSLVLIACSDSDGNFILDKIGFAGRNSDANHGSIFHAKAGTIVKENQIRHTI